MSCRECQNNTQTLVAPGGVALIGVFAFEALRSFRRRAWRIGVGETFSINRICSAVQKEPCKRIGRGNNPEALQRSIARTETLYLSASCLRLSTGNPARMSIVCWSFVICPGFVL